MFLNYRGNDARVKFTLIVLFMIIGGCSDKFSINEVSGKYFISFNTGVDTITLNANRTYIHTYVPKSGEMQRQDGVWAIEELPSGSNVVLSRFQSFLPDRNSDESIYLLPIRKSFGDIYLITNIDLNDGYRKCD